MTKGIDNIVVKCVDKGKNIKDIINRCRRSYEREIYANGHNGEEKSVKKRLRLSDESVLKAIVRIYSGFPEIVDEYQNQYKVLLAERMKSLRPSRIRGYHQEEKRNGNILPRIYPDMSTLVDRHKRLSE